MTLAALYVHEHFLFEKPQTLNFGGRYVYEFSKSDDDILTVSVRENQSYIKNFWDKEISLISALVGANGAGKTNILKIINTGFQEHTKAVFIYENVDGTFSVDNRTGERIDSGQYKEGTGFSIVFPLGLNYSKFNQLNLTKLYFSPVFDPKTESFFSPLDLNSSNPERKINEVFMDNVRRDTVFLHSNVSKVIKDIYPDFPIYDALNIIPKKLHKRDFRKVYIDTNIGNPQKTETLMHTIERDLRVGDYRDTGSLLREYLKIIKSSNITDALNDIWNMPQYQNKTEHFEHLVHDSGDFLKNIEINLLSFLIINDTFGRTEISGTFDFERILKSASFYEILDNYLIKYIVQIDKNFYQYEDKIRLDNYTELTDIVMKHYSLNQLTYKDLQTHTELKSNVLHNINGLMNIKRLHGIFMSLSKDIVYENDKSILKIDVEREDVDELLAALFDVYSKVREYFSNLPMGVKDIIDIESNVNLSYGEKSILNLYSAFYEFTQTRSHMREAENFLLILDEADLGYHPIWKRKFIYALSRTMSLIFSKLTPMVWDVNTKTNKRSEKKRPNLQIIIATHDPLTLSDFPNSNVVYLWKSGQKGTAVLDNHYHSMKSFGANITDLLAHSFFVQDGLIGDFAKYKIEDTITWLNEEKIKKDISGSSYRINHNVYNYHESIIKIIDEPVIRIKLAQMLDGLNEQKKIQRDLLQREIDLLNEKLDRL